MSSKLRAKATQRKANQKARMAPRHEAQVALREYDRQRHATHWEEVRKREREEAKKAVA